jgi:large subunit ribosomal protein L17
MIKNLNKRKLSRTGAHRRALLRNLAVSLFQNEKITTTLPKAKELSSYSERLITLARPGDLNAKRAVEREIKDKQVFQKIFGVLVPRYQGRMGGYTQVLRLGSRRGDRAEMAVIRLIS